ncbi:MAG: hypothetical protein AAFX85_02720 [Pseudomonadota bacterium]
MIPEILVSLLAVAAFAFAFWRVGVVAVSQRIVKTAVSGVAAMMDAELDDDAKEVAVRQAGFALLGAAVSVALRTALALLVAAVPVAAAHLVGIVSISAVIGLMSRLEFLVGVTVLAVLIAAVARRLRPGQETADNPTDGAPYSPADRLFHVLAFASPAVLKVASGTEDLLLRPRIAPTPPAPIFITSLHQN